MTTPHLKVLAPGLCTLVVDLGRPRWRSLGVPVGGAADRAAYMIGNALVGNPPDAAAIEFTLAGPTLRANCPMACVLTGAPFEAHADGRAIQTYHTFTLEPDETLQVNGTPRGARGYLCVQDGFRSREILGSRSSLVPLEAGDEIGCQAGVIKSRFIRPEEAGLTVPESPCTVRVLKGPQADWFPPGILDGNHDNEPVEYRVSTKSDRMGLRLEGRPIPVPEQEMISEPVCPGTIQVTRDGQCIILGVDGQTIGGYPKIAQVISADLSLLGQLRPGNRVRFNEIKLEEAERSYLAWDKQVRHWCLRLRTVHGVES
jgi:biotin-dependent carboxylase-like uncharacterized protein